MPAQRAFPDLVEPDDSNSWPVRIRSLGRFELQVDGQVLHTEGQSGGKPLALLLRLVSHGGHFVRIEDLIAALWGRHIGDARGVFDVTLLRLRKMLRRSDALLVRNGELAFNPRVCWFDLWHFESCLQPHHAEPDAAIVRALKSYRGPFLPQAGDHPASIAIRERLRALFQVAVMQVGARLERSHGWFQAVDIYHHATEADSLVEEYYYRQMLCQARLGRLADVRQTYERCRHRLSEELSVAPSARLDRMLQEVAAVPLNVTGHALSIQEPAHHVARSTVVILADHRAHSTCPITIRTLGRFALAVQGTAQASTAKGQRQPLDILRAIVALGGPGIPAPALIDAVWNSDTVAPRGAFDTALLRLRKLLRRNDAVRLQAGVVTLNPELCWVDAWEFEETATRFLKTRSLPDAQRAIALYGGEFLGRTDSARCATVMRERLSQKFRSIITTAGDLCERAHDWDGAARLYQAGIAAEAGVENFYQRLIHCHWRMGRQADAVRVYRRCCDTLRVLSQSCPSAITTALYRQVLAPSAATS